MYIIVAGGGKVGYYLTKTLLSEGYEVLLIEKNSEKVEIFQERFGAVLVEGDAAEAGETGAGELAAADAPSSAAIARNNLRRSPSNTPSFSKSRSVRSRKISASIAFSRNAAS